MGRHFKTKNQHLLDVRNAKQVFFMGGFVMIFGRIKIVVQENEGQNEL